MNKKKSFQGASLPGGAAAPIELTPGGATLLGWSGGGASKAAVADNTCTARTGPHVHNVGKAQILGMIQIPSCLRHNSDLTYSGSLRKMAADQANGVPVLTISKKYKRNTLPGRTTCVP
jgi:hypothetical protein